MLIPQDNSTGFVIYATLFISNIISYTNHISYICYMAAGTIYHILYGIYPRPGLGLAIEDRWMDGSLLFVCQDKQ